MMYQLRTNFNIRINFQILDVHVDEFLFLVYLCVFESNVNFSLSFLFKMNLDSHEFYVNWCY